MESQRVAYFDALRVFASFAVMLLHLAAQHWGDVAVEDPAWQVFNGYNAAVRWCVPVFVMISGALFLEDPIPLKKLYGKHVARMAVAFVLWSGFYALVNLRRYHLTPPQFAGEWVQGHYHLWFLYMIAGLYALTPLLREMVRSERLTRYFLLLSFFFCFLLPELVALISLFLPQLGNALSASLAYADLRFVTGFGVYFVLGYYLRHHTLRRREEPAIYLLGILGFAGTMLGTHALSLRASAPNELLYGYCTVNVLFESAAIFTLFRKHLNKPSPLLRALSDASFGAYLIHALVIDTLQFRFGLDTLALPPLLSVPALAVTVFTCSYALSLLLRKVPLIREIL